MTTLFLCNCNGVQIDFCTLMGIMVFVIMICTIIITVFTILRYVTLEKIKKLVRIIAEVEECIRR